jgi:hypothetical protein
MSDSDARMIVMSEVSCQGQPVLFSELRLNRATVHKSLYVYEVRCTGTDPLVPASVEKQVQKNFYGTLIATRPLDLGCECCLLLRRGFDFKRENVMSHSEFCAKHRVRHKERDSHER